MSNGERLAEAVKCFADPCRRQEYFNLYSEDIVLHGYAGVEQGLESVKHFYNAFWDVFPDTQVIIHELIEHDDMLVVRYVITGTQAKDFMGVPAVGRQIELPGISILPFKNGRCFERWTCSDSLSLLRQISGTSAAGAS